MKKVFSLIFLLFGCFSFLTAQQTPNQNRIYVKTAGSGDGSSWENASGNLKDVLENAANSEIWVAAGIYKADISDATASFILKNGNTMYGGFLGNESSLAERATSDMDENGSIEPWEFTNASILTGELQDDLDSSNNTHHILRMLPGDIHTLIDGFTIKYGYSVDSIASGIVADSGYISNCIILKCDQHSDNVDDIEFPQVYGAGIAAFKSNISGTKVMNCTLVPVNVLLGGVATGGGIYCNMSSLENCTVSNCRITTNLYSTLFGGDLFANQSTISNCLFENGFLKLSDGNYSTFGGGVALANGCLLRNSEIRNCSSKRFGGGIYTENSTILNCKILNNQVYGQEEAEKPAGGGVYLYNGTLAGSLIAGNSIYFDGFSRTYGAGVYGGTLINCTVVKNSGAMYGDGIYGQQSATNSIFWGNDDDQGIDGGTNNAIQGATDLSNGTIKLEAENSGNESGKYYPWFINPESNWDIRPSSSCINKGTINPPAQIGSKDLLNRTRVYGGRIDIGAYEVQSFFGINQAANVTPVIIPNPSADYISVKGIPAGTEIFIFSLNGDCVLQAKSGKQDRFDIRNLPAGKYLLSIPEFSTKRAEFIKY